MCPTLTDEATKAPAARRPLRKEVFLRVTSAHPLSAASRYWLSNTLSIVAVHQKEVHIYFKKRGRREAGRKSDEVRTASGRLSGRMDKTRRTIIVVFLLFVLSGMPAECQTLDVCATCHPNATCEDKSDGSGKVCNCKYGFVGNGRTFCQDKDECQIEANKICGQHTMCHNTFGSYYCSCLAGYSPSNNMAVFIPNDGTHCQDIDECSITGLCGEGGRCRNLDGSFDCSCQTGYQVHNGYEPFHPQRNSAFCKVVECGQPPSEEDTELLSVTGTTFGSVATFGCDEGFVWRRGENSSVCGADGLWRGPTLVCEEIMCGNPPLIELTEQVWNNKSTPGSSVLYLCKKGFYNKGGQNVSICNENGQWTSPSLSCQEILCGDPPVVLHTGQVWNGSSTPGSTVTYFCTTGFYQSDGNNVSVCTSNGYWTKPDMLCKEIDCGEPLPIPHTVMLWDKTSTLGSYVAYKCDHGYLSIGKGNESVCTSSGKWDATSLSCQEISCGEPLFKPHAKRLWDGTSHIGSVVYYQCEEGYYTRGLKNYSECGENGRWEEIDQWCEEISCGLPLTLPNTKQLWDGNSTQGSVVRYVCMDGFYQESGNHISTCSLSGEWGKISLTCRAKCGPVPFLANSEVVWHNRSVVIHRCEAGYHSWRGSNMSVCDSSGVWQRASLICIESKPPINHLSVYNANCLRWKAEKYEEDTEVYKVTYAGFRDYQRDFHDKGRRFLSSKADQLELCLNLLPLTNYSISMTAVSAKFTATITTNTSLPVPSAPVVYYKEFETSKPTLRLRRSPNTLDPVSFYQVFVLPVEGVMMFDCSFPSSLASSSKLTSPTEYIAAQLDVLNLEAEVNFTVGDGFFYGGFYNAPLESGKNYYILLRAVSQWKMASKSCCVLWAKVTGASYVLRVSSLTATAVVGVAALVILLGYSFSWCVKKM
ncbi:sushi domain-containing protein 1 isoform X2 [Melanotaenia boesemani]|uniref:sushi domain-containing protein 1 isoform X2 n=1 Tax=Melanotaenia boesemani TaxID=1250792 RepID=UPI001C045CA7|nr:sushi domain-containing protein 1 isoform X2 [Melanotaenia boesemani]